MNTLNVKLGKLKLAAGVAIALAGAGGIAQATSITFSGSSSTGILAASATFDTSGTNLIVTLTNTSAFDVLVPAQVLTAIFFDLPGVGALSSVSAVLNSGSTVFFDTAPVDGVVGGEWAYGSGLAGAPSGATEGISSSGLELFGGPTFPGSNLAGPPNGAVDGLQYGITSAGDNPATGNSAVTAGGFPLIQNSVVFTLSGLPAGFALNVDTVTNVSFQYGTALTEPNIPGECDEGCTPITEVPEPTTLTILGLGMLALGAIRRRKVA